MTMTTYGIILYFIDVLVLISWRKLLSCEDNLCVLSVCITFSGSAKKRDPSGVAFSPGLKECIFDDKK